MADAGDRKELWNKRKAITTLLPYAVRLERDGMGRMLDVCLRAAVVADDLGFVWFSSKFLADIFLSKATTRATLLVSPHFHWSFLDVGLGLVRQWVATVSVTPCTEEVAQGVVATLLRVMSQPEFRPHITFDVWSWLKRRPSLPPVCAGRRCGTHSNNVKAVRRLNDPEVFKSYLVVVWSEWNSLRGSGFDEMRDAIPQDFGGSGMGHHRADLIQRLGCVLGQLDRGIDYLRQHKPGVDEDDFEDMKDQYGELRGILLEVNIKAIARTSCLTQ